MPGCEMCGREGDLVPAEVEGVELKLCPKCTKYGKVKSRKGPFSNFSLPSKPILKESPEFKIVPNFSELIRSARENSKLSQEDFAKFLNERESIIAKWESGSLSPSLDLARKLERALGIKLVEKEEPSTVEKLAPEKRNSDEFTLGDFIKVRKRK